MDKFEKILREKLANHDAGMANGAWEQFAQNFDKVQGFEHALRTKLHNHDAGMQNGAWEQFEQRLNQPSTSNWVNYLTAGIAAVLVGVGVYYFSGETTIKNTTKPAATETTLANNNVKGNSVTTDNNVVNDKTASNKNDVVITDNNQNSVENNNGVAVDNNAGNNNANNNIVNNNNNAVNNAVNNNNVKENNNNVVNNNVNVNNGNEKVNGNNDNDVVVNNATPMLAPEISGMVSELCQNEELVLKAANAKPGYGISWLLNGEEISNETSVKLNLNKEGMQTIQLVYTATENGKQTTAVSEKSTVNVLAAPHAEFNIDRADNEAYPEHTFTRTEGKDLTAMWNYGDGNFSTDESGSHVYRKKGTYITTLTVTGNNGCQAKFSNKVEVAKDYNLLAPNGFSPNGDGINETFIPAALTVMTEAQFKMTIYDRTGKRIYETSRADAPWDGVDATTGAKCNTNAYSWRVVMTMPGHKPETYSGTITLLDK